jgi:hypothetical protein
MSKTSKTLRAFKTKKGVEIAAGESVTLSFDVKVNADGVRADVHPFRPDYVRMTTSDGRVILTRDFKGAGIKLPSQKKLDWWSFDSVAKSVFGTDVEPDGWSYDGSPSWLLALNLI